METLKIQTNLNYMGVEIPVSITQEHADIPKHVPLITFYRKGKYSMNYHLADMTNDSGAIIFPDEKMYRMKVMLSDKFYNGTAPDSMLETLNSRIKYHMGLILCNIPEIDELIIELTGDTDFILPIIDYITDRHKDFKRINIYVSENEDIDFCYRVRDLIEHSRILDVKEEIKILFAEIYGKNPH